MKLSITLFVIIALAGCSNNSSTGSNNNNSNDSTTYYGANYLSFTENPTMMSHISGTINELDTFGNITSTNQVDQDWNVGIGFPETHDGQSVLPIFGYDAHGNITNYGKPVAYGGTLDSEVFAMNQFNAEDATILPQVISIGQTWTPAANILPIHCQAKADQHLAQFTAKDGTSYSDLLEVTATYLDSSSYHYYIGNVNFYFANGIGLVEADVIQYEHIVNVLGAQYLHETGSGSVYRKN